MITRKELCLFLVQKKGNCQGTTLTCPKCSIFRTCHACLPFDMETRNNMQANPVERMLVYTLWRENVYKLAIEQYLSMGHSKEDLVGLLI